MRQHSIRLGLRNLSELTRAGAEQRLRVIGDRIRHLRARSRQHSAEGDYEWFADSGAEEEVYDHLRPEAFATLRRFPDLMSLGVPENFSKMTREHAAARVESLQKEDQLSLRIHGDSVYATPAYKANQLEIAFLRENLV